MPPEKECKPKNGTLKDIVMRWSVPLLLAGFALWASVQGLKKDMPVVETKVETSVVRIGKLETRMAVGETKIETLESAVHEIKSDIRAQNTMLSRIERAVVNERRRDR